MALEFKDKLEAIRFGDMVAQPIVDIEQRLRLQNIKLDEPSGVREAITVISECFSDKSDKVKEYIEKNLSIVDIAQLQVYLVGGQKMLDKVNKDLEAEDGE